MKIKIETFGEQEGAIGEEAYQKWRKTLEGLGFKLLRTYDSNAPQCQIDSDKKKQEGQGYEVHEVNSPRGLQFFIKKSESGTETIADIPQPTREGVKKVIDIREASDNKLEDNLRAVG